MSQVRDRLPFKLNGVGYVIEPRGVVRQPLTRFAAAQDQAPEPGEQTLGNEGTWKRGQSDFIHGAGQPVFDLIDQSTRQGFYRAHNIDPFTARRELRVGPKLETVTPPTSFNVTRVIASASRLWVITSADSYSTSNPEVASPTWTQRTGLGGSLAGLHPVAYDAATDDLYCVGDNLYKIAGTGSSWSNFSADPIDSVWIANGRLIGSKDDDLFEIASDGTRSDIAADLGGSVAWSSVVGTPHGIFAATLTGLTTKAASRDHVYRFDVDETDGSLQERVIALTLPTGERITSMASIGDLLFLGIFTTTHFGMRMTRIADNGTITTGPLIRFEQPFGYPTLFNAPSLLLHGDRLYMTCVDPYGVGGSPLSIGAGLILFDLRYLLDELTPAWTHYTSDTTAALPGGITAYDNVLYLACGSNGLRRVSPTEHAEVAGYESGQITFGVTEQKIPANLEVAHVGFDDTEDVMTVMVRGGGGIETGIVDGDIYRLDLSDIAASETLEIFFSYEYQGGGNLENIVAIYRWTLRALVLPGAGGDDAVGPEEEVFVPVLIAREVQSSTQGGKFSMDPLSEYQALCNLRNAGTAVTMEMGGLTETVRVADVLMPEGNPGRLDRLPAAAKAGDGFFEGVYVLRLLNVPG